MTRNTQEASSFERKMTAVIITRILDIITTYLNVNKWGYGVELIPFNRFLLERHLFIPFQLIVLMGIWIFVELCPKYRNVLFIGITTLSIIAIINNLFCFIFIR